MIGGSETVITRHFVPMQISLIIHFRRRAREDVRHHSPQKLKTLRNTQKQGEQPQQQSESTTLRSELTWGVISQHRHRCPHTADGCLSYLSGDLREDVVQEAEGGHVEKLVAQFWSTDDRFQHRTSHRNLPCHALQPGSEEESE